MRRIDTNDMDMVMSVKSRGNSRRYAFADYSDKIKVRNPTAKILRDRRKQIKNQTQKTMGKPMAGANALMELKASMRKPQLTRLTAKVMGNVRCNTTHIWDGSNWTKFIGILTVSQVKNKFPNVRELMYSKDGEEFGDSWYTVSNVH